MPTPNEPCLLPLIPPTTHAGTFSETQLLRRLAQQQEAELTILRAEVAELQTLLDAAQRRATVAECRLRTQETDHKAEIAALKDDAERLEAGRMAAWRGRN